MRRLTRNRKQNIPIYPTKAVGNEGRALIVESNIATKAQSTDLSVTTKANELNVEPITQTLNDLNFGAEAQKLPSDDLKLVKEEDVLIVAHIQLQDEATFELCVSVNTASMFVLKQ